MAISAPGLHLDVVLGVGIVFCAHGTIMLPSPLTFRWRSLSTIAQATFLAHARRLLHAIAAAIALFSVFRSLIWTGRHDEADEALRSLANVSAGFYVRCVSPPVAHVPQSLRSLIA